jgi:hypothetical protein
MGPICYPEPSVRIYDFTLSNNTEERRSHLHRGGSLKSHILYSTMVHSCDNVICKSIRRCSSVSIVTTLQARRLRNFVAIYCKTNTFSLLQNVKTDTDTTSTGYIFQRVKWPGRESNRLPPTIAEIKNVWSYTSSPQHALTDSKKEKVITILL